MREQGVSQLEKIENRKSKIENRKSKIGNRKSYRKSIIVSKIENRIDNRKSTQHVNNVDNM